LFITTTTIGRPWRTIASNSPIAKPAAPSPVMHMTLRPGAAFAAPIAAPNPMPMHPNRLCVKYRAPEGIRSASCSQCLHTAPSPMTSASCRAAASDATRAAA
jgi:hypothetical protein